MKDIVEKIDIIKHKIIKEFYDNKIHLSSCLAQSYILYKYIYDLTHKSLITPKIIKGYIVNHIDEVYYGHFWVEYNNKTYDIATETYLLDYDVEKHSFIKENMRVLVKELSDDIKQTYTNKDSPMFHIVRKKSYKMCMKHQFLKDVKRKAPFEIYKRIENIHNKILNHSQ